MPTRYQLIAILAVATVIWGATLYLRGLPLSWSHVEPFSYAVTGASAACFAFDRWLWHWWIFRGWFVKRPYLKGTWRAELKSTYHEPTTNAQIPPIHAIMVISQTHSSLGMRLFTDQASSHVVASSIREKVQGSPTIYELVAVYLNQPSIQHRQTGASAIHFGSVLLEIEGIPCTTLRGHYWTDRATNGEITLRSRRPKLAGSLESGLALYRPQRPFFTRIQSWFRAQWRR